MGRERCKGCAGQCYLGAAGARGCWMEQKAHSAPRKCQCLSANLFLSQCACPSPAFLSLCLSWCAVTACWAACWVLVRCQRQQGGDNPPVSSADPSYCWSNAGTENSDMGLGVELGCFIRWMTQGPKTTAQRPQPQDLGPQDQT